MFKVGDEVRIVADYCFNNPTVNPSRYIGKKGIIKTINSGYDRNIEVTIVDVYGTSYDYVFYEKELALLRRIEKTKKIGSQI